MSWLDTVSRVFANPAEHRESLGDGYAGQVLRAFEGAAYEPLRSGLAVSAACEAAYERAFASAEVGGAALAGRNRLSGAPGRGCGPHGAPRRGAVRD